MNKNIKKQYWNEFIKTGKVEAYLNYRTDTSDKENPRKRIVENTKNRHFY